MTIADQVLNQYYLDDRETTLNNSARHTIRTISKKTPINTIWIFEDDSYLVKAFLGAGNEVKAHIAKPQQEWVKAQMQVWKNEALSESFLKKLFNSDKKRILSELQKLPLFLQP